MTKQKKQLIIILIILAICVLALVGVKLYNQHVSDAEAEESASDSVEIYGAEADDITAFGYTDSNGETVSLSLDGDTWLNANDNTMDLDEDAITSMLSYFTSISSTKQITDADPSEYGFDTPSNEFTVTTADQTVTLTYGMKNEMTEEYYLILNGDTTVIYVTDGSLLTLADTTLSDLLYDSSADADATNTDSTDATSDTTPTE